MKTEKAGNVRFLSDEAGTYLGSWCPTQSAGIYWQAMNGQSGFAKTREEAEAAIKEALRGGDQGTR